MLQNIDFRDDEDLKMVGKIIFGIPIILYLLLVSFLFISQVVSPDPSGWGGLFFFFFYLPLALVHIILLYIGAKLFFKKLYLFSGLCALYVIFDFACVWLLGLDGLTGYMLNHVYSLIL